MIRLSFVRHLPVSPERVWPWVSSPERISAWASLQMRRAAPGPSGSHDEAGATRTVHMRAGPFPMRMVERLIEVVPARRLVYRVSGWGHRRHEGVVTLEPQDGGTHLTWRVQLAPRLPGTGGWLRRTLECQFVEDLSVLERLVADGA